MENGNEPAFPTISDEYVSHQWGLSKREYFAGLAMQGLLTDANIRTLGWDGLAELSVGYADTLLKKLNEQ